MRRRRRSVSVGTVDAPSLNSTLSVVVSFSVGDIVGLDVGKGDGRDVGPCDGDSEGPEVGLRYQNRSSGILLCNGFCFIMVLLKTTCRRLTKELEILTELAKEVE